MRFPDIFKFSFLSKIDDDTSKSMLLNQLNTQERTQLTSMSRIITLVPFVYKKFFPLGSPFRTVGAPLTVRGKEENIAPGNTNKSN